MADRYILTQSLLSAYAYMFDCYEGGEDDAKAEFEQTLLRIKSPPTAAMKNGIDFENLVYSIVTNTFRPAFVPDGTLCKASYGDNEPMGKNVYPKWYPGAKAIADRLMGAQLQVRASRPITIDGAQYLIYGVLDGLRAGVIYDVKFKNKSFGKLDLAGSYRESPQHPFYFYIVPEAFEFQYLVSDGEDLYTEIYHPDECPTAERIIRPFLSYLESEKLMDVYRQHWKAK